MAGAAERDVEQIGRYTVICPLARGGMAEVFLVRATGLQGFQKVVALKRILPRYAGDAEFIRMFLAEARLAANLEHPNVATVHDIGREGEDYFFTMEYVHGETLRAILRRAVEPGRELPLAQAVTIGIGVAAGIAHAHDRIGYDGTKLGLVHRDISPTNVIVSYDGVVKVLDFGIAKAAESSYATTEGTRKGKVAYMSPEQLRDESLDHRSDIFAIGILLWEMVTRRPLFDGGNEFAIMRKILDEPVPAPSTIEPLVPPDLDAIVLRALSPNPDGRFESARVLQRELEAVARDHRYDATTGALRGYMEATFGFRPFPWQDSGRGRSKAADADATVAATADLPPTRVASPADLPMPATPVTEDPSLSWPGTPRWGRALLVASVVGLGVGVIAWAVWPSGRESSARVPTAESPAAPDPVGEPVAAPPPDEGSAPEDDAANVGATTIAVEPPGAVEAETSPPPPTKSPRRGTSDRSKPSRDPGKAKPDPATEDKPDYDRLFDF